MCFCIEDTEMEEEADDVALFHCALIFKYIKKWMRWYFLNSWLFIYSVFRRSAVQTEPWWVWTHSIRQQLHNNRWTDDLCHLPPSPSPRPLCTTALFQIFHLRVMHPASHPPSLLKPCLSGIIWWAVKHKHIKMPEPVTLCGGGVLVPKTSLRIICMMGTFYGPCQDFDHKIERHRIS